MRPSMGKIREYIFNVLQPFEAERVNDLFAGTGALGIEALSRGAEYVHFVDNHSCSLRLIRENLDRIGVPKDCRRCTKANALHFLERTDETFDLLLADPPYGLDLPEAFFRSCREHLNPGGIFVLEYSARKIDSGDWESSRYKKSGSSAVWMFRR
ncbi:MAG: RsmD family RNA methyltransferase [Candidatus Marinimicrobia bacterium]|nr:RsmD family RNA methyltransferase [Candidatus Neomarinimicrobiota bacterium]